MASWSGGKDACLALHRSRREGHEPVALLSMLIEDGTRSRSHGLRRDVLEAQADSLGLPLLLEATSWADYEAAMVRGLLRARDAGAEAAVFGDIDLEPHRAWEEGVCRQAGLEPLLPLWRNDRRALVHELLTAGFDARVVVVREGRLPPEFLGRRLDLCLLDAVEAAGCDACGEAGEYHSVVVDGPGFARPVALEAGPRVRVQDVWCLDLALPTLGR